MHLQMVGFSYAQNFWLYPAVPRRHVGRYCSKRIRQLGLNADGLRTNLLSHISDLVHLDRPLHYLTSLFIWCLTLAGKLQLHILYYIPPHSTTFWCRNLSDFRANNMDMPNVFYHYTSKACLKSILDSGVILPSRPHPATPGWLAGVNLNAATENGSVFLTRVDPKTPKNSIAFNNFRFCNDID